MRLVIALGGNALMKRGEETSLEVQGRNARAAAQAIAGLAREHDVVVTHGNGPQVGLLAMQAESLPEGPRVPLDVLVAESEGLIGYLLGRELVSLLPGRQVATVLTQTVVDPADPALQRPTKPIGPVYDRMQGQALAASLGWTMVADGDGLRRVVPSPAPEAVVELPTVRLLLDHGVLVVCAGGGGVPVMIEADGQIRGVEAVVDKDATSAWLATRLQADVLLLLTDVDAVYEDWPARRHPIRHLSVDAWTELALDAGSMGPKVRAACMFAATGGRAAIGALLDAPAVLAGRAGTTVNPE